MFGMIILITLTLTLVFCRRIFDPRNKVKLSKRMGDVHKKT